MKSTKRALRRHHRGRLICHALRCNVLSREPGEDLRLHRERVLGWYDNLKKCSCHMCGNPRRYGGLPTRQELRLMEAHRNDARRQNGFGDDALPPQSSRADRPGGKTGRYAP